LSILVGSATWHYRPKCTAATRCLRRLASLLLTIAFYKISSDAKYHALTQHPEFRETFGLLNAYRDLQSAATKSTLALPPATRNNF